MRPRLAVSIVTLACAGCAVLRIPAWTERAEPIEPSSPVADHRERRYLRFVVLGDAGTGGAGQYRVADLAARACRDRGGCDLVLVAGDNVYPRGIRPNDRRLDERFELPYAPFGRLDFWMAAGNHDWYRRGSVDAEVRYTDASSRWRMLSHDYGIPRLPPWLHVYVLDTTKLVAGRHDGQVERARAALCGAAGWRLLLGHHPVYASGEHTDRSGVVPRVERALVAPLIEPCAVQLYLSGHEHHQEHLSAPAFDQVVQGAGARPRPPREVRARPVGVRQVAVASDLGFALVEVEPARLRLEFLGCAGERAVPLHCREFEPDRFASPAERSRPCAQPL